MDDDRDPWDDDYYFMHMHSGDSGNYSWGCSGSIFKFVLIVIVVIIVLALLLGVGIPLAVWEFFLKIIAVVGVFTLIGRLGSRK